MLETIAGTFKEKFGTDLNTGLLGMFVFLHFYYGVPTEGWEKSGVGFTAVLGGTFILSLIGYMAGNGFRSTLTLIAAALALDFFYRGQLGRGAEHVVFEYLWNGPAAVNFASFGASSVWFFSQLDPSKKYMWK